MRDAGLFKNLARIIMRMVTIGACCLLWNGELTDIVRPSKGLRQGNPFSPYLLVLCMEKLGQWFRGRIEEGRLREVKASRTVPGLSHLFFADDLLIFFEAREDQLFCIKEGL